MVHNDRSMYKSFNDQFINFTVGYIQRLSETGEHFKTTQLSAATKYQKG